MQACGALLGIPSIWPPAHSHTQPAHLLATVLNATCSLCPAPGTSAVLVAGSGSSQRRLIPSPVLRGQLLYRRPFYLYLMASNLVLRLSWAYKLSPHLRHHHVVVFLIVLAEAFRCVAEGVGWGAGPIV